MGVPIPQTYRWPCISPLVLKIQQKHEFKERTGREETWGWQKWAIQCRQWTTVMRTEVCIENDKEHTSHLYNNFVKTLIILCGVFWSHSLIQPLSSLSTSQALSFEPHPHLTLSLFCVSPLLCEACPGGWSAYRDSRPLWKPTLSSQQPLSFWSRVNEVSVSVSAYVHLPLSI